MEKYLLFFVITIQYMTSVTPLEYNIRYQPELDWVTIDPYIQNPRLFNLQVRCIIDDGPCDVVGRWVKPRVAAALLGTCIKCTKHQEGEVNKFLQWVQENHPDIFRKAVVKYVESQGIKLPVENGNVTVNTFPTTSTPAVQNQNENLDGPDRNEENSTTTPGS